MREKIKKKKEEGIVEEGLEFADDTPYINEDEEKAAEGIKSFFATVG